MGSLARKIERQREKDELLNIRNLYHKNQKHVSKMQKEIIIYDNDKGKIFCIRCDQLVNIKEK